MKTSEPVALVCPLDWGIGHASRCVPVIKALREHGWKVIVAADGRPFEFYRKEYPEQELVRFSGAMVRYPKGSGMVLSMAASIPRLLMGFRKEHECLKKLINETRAGLVISDNRYGCWNRDVKSVFMTHQLNIMLPPGMRFVSPLLRMINFSFIKRYDECWIPDFQNHDGLSGRLSHCSEMPGNSHFIGALSRFAYPVAEPAVLPCPPAGIFIMLSGPEPQRSILEDLLISQLVKTSHTAIIAGGRTESEQYMIIEGRIRVFAHLPLPLMKHYIEKAEFVICRSGYSTLMDLAALGKSALLIPTPGQTEQEYLALRLSKMNVHYTMPQNKFRLSEALLNSKGLKGFFLQNDLRPLNERLKGLYPQDAAIRVR